MYRYCIFAALLCLFTAHTIDAQDQSKRFELFVSLGSHSLDDVDPPGDEDLGGHLSFHMTHYLKAQHGIGLRYSAILYEEGSNEYWLNDIYATYRYSFRTDKPTHIYLEGGLGLSDAVEGYDDEGRKFGLTLAAGVKRFLGDHLSVGVEGRSIGFQQLGSQGNDVTVGVGELSIVLGYLF